MVGDKVWQLGPRGIYHNATFKGIILTYLFRARIARDRHVFRPMSQDTWQILE